MDPFSQRCIPAHPPVWVRTGGCRSQGTERCVFGAFDSIERACLYAHYLASWASDRGRLGSPGAPIPAARTHSTRRVRALHSAGAAAHAARARVLHAAWWPGWAAACRAVVHEMLYTAGVAAVQIIVGEKPRGDYMGIW